MKTILTASALCTAIGVTVGWITASDHCKAKALEEQAAYAEAVTEVVKRAVHYQAISEEYYADYQEAINREPTVITERVFVRANCPANAAADSGGSVGNAGAGQRAELHPETVRSATAVTDQAERDVLSCRAALHSLQAKIKTHNELQQ